MSDDHEDAPATISRRSAIAAGGAALAMAATGTATALRPRESGFAARRRPNVVFILADDLGAHDLSCYGRPDFKTPRIDSLAKHGIQLQRAYANSASCRPTRTGLVSGRYQSRFAIDQKEGPGLGFPLDHPTLPGIFKAAGYRTGLVGKWHLGAPPEFGPLRYGYDEFFGLTNGAFDYFTHDLSALGGTPRVPDLWENDRKVRMEGYATDIFTQRALQFIDDHESRPFLLSLHYTAPHWPWQTRKDAGAARQSDFHFDGGTPAIFAEMVGAMDEGIGRILDLIEKIGLTRSTIIAFTSDNGGERYSYMWPLRGGKGELWEGGIRVPGLVRWPGRIRAGSTSDQVLLSMDWLSTLAEACEVPLPSGYVSDGQSVLLQLTGTPAVERTVFWRSGPFAAAMRGRWKYLRNGRREFLYDLATDPTEHANAKGREPQIFASLKAEYEAWNATMLPLDRSAEIEAEIFLDMEALSPPRGGRR